MKDNRHLNSSQTKPKGHAKPKGRTKKPRKPETKAQRTRGLSRFYRYGTIIFILFFAFFMVVNVITKPKMQSEVENRTLEQKPELRASEFFSGDYSKKYNKYISDQFAGRQGFIKFKTNFEILMGKKEINGVFISMRGNLIEKFDKVPGKNTDAKIDAINSFKKKNPDMKLSVLLAPTACEINSDLLPKNVPVTSETRYFDYVKNRLSKSIKLINTFDVMKKNSSRYLYYRTDHHWTSLGAYIAYRELAKYTDLNRGSESDYKQMIASNDFKGSLHSKVAGARGKKDDIVIYVPEKNIDLIVRYEDKKKKVASLYDSKSLDQKDQYEVFTQGNHPILKIKSTGAKNRRLLLIKDSYANSMLPFLVQNYSEIIVVDLRYYSKDINKLVKDEGINEALILYNINTFDEDSSILDLQ